MNNVSYQIGIIRIILVCFNSEKTTSKNPCSLNKIIAIWFNAVELCGFKIRKRIKLF